MAKILDLTGRIFGRLTARWFVGYVGKARMYHWLCSCECGGLVTTSVANLTSGGSTSCGCYSREVRGKCNFKHGKSRTPEYIMWQMAKHRAREKGLPFNIDATDVVIPALCPMLRIPLFQSGRVLQDNSPTLDRRDGSRGSVKENVRVISYKANRSKNNLTFDEMKLMVANWDS